MSTFSNGNSTLSTNDNFSVDASYVGQVSLESLLNGIDYTDSANSSGFFDGTSFSSLDDSFRAVSQTAVTCSSSSNCSSSSSDQSPGATVASATSLSAALDACRFGQLDGTSPGLLAQNQALQALLFADCHSSSSPIKQIGGNGDAADYSTGLSASDFSLLFNSLQLQPQSQQQQQHHHQQQLLQQPYSFSTQASWPPDELYSSGGRHSAGKRSLLSASTRPITGQRSSYGQPSHHHHHHQHQQQQQQQQQHGPPSQRSPGLSPSSAWSVTSKWQQRHGQLGGSWNRRTAPAGESSWSTNPLESLRACLDSHLLDNIGLPTGTTDGVDGLGDSATTTDASYYGDGGAVAGSLREERYSRKVFVGGLPPDIDEDEITNAFRRFGSLVIDWPHKNESKTYFPPKGYCFILFQEEASVQSLMEACIADEGKFYWCVSSPTMKDKPVQIRPWNLADSDFVLDSSQPLDPRKTIFVGGVPRPLRASELALLMNRLYGGVCYAGIDTDPELKYPKGAGRVAFSSQQSYIAAIGARFVQLRQGGEIDKRVEVKPYVLDDQMCDECGGAMCGGKYAPFFCANVACLQYYCDHCWAAIHDSLGRQFHKPLVKEGADRPRTVPYRW